MSNFQFEVYYNGHPVAVTSIGNNTFLVQISYKPLQLQLQKDDSGERWIDVTTKQETNITQELGWLIREQVTVGEPA